MRKVKKQQAPTPRLKTIIKAQIEDDGIMWWDAYEVNEHTNWDRRKLEKLRDKKRLTYRTDGKNVEYDAETVLRRFQLEKQFKTA